MRQRQILALFSVVVDSASCSHLFIGLRMAQYLKVTKKNRKEKKTQERLK